MQTEHTKPRQEPLSDIMVNNLIKRSLNSIHERIKKPVMNCTQNGRALKYWSGAPT